MQVSPGVGNTIVNNNQVHILEYRGAQLAAFNVEGRGLLICLPQAFELFLKQFVGGLHTVYTKLKRLDIQPVVCNVEQVRILRGLGAIQPGVNRCKLIAPREFDILYADCTTSSARPGRPSKRTSKPLYLQESLNLSLNSHMVLPGKTPRLDLSSNQNSDPIRGLNILQLLSLPPETVFEWFRLSWIGEKQHSNTNLPVCQPSILSNTLEKYKLNEKIDSLLTDLRSNVLRTGDFLNGSSIPRPEELLPNIPSVFTSPDENPSSTLFTQNNWWGQGASSLEPLNPSLNIPLFDRNEEVMELSKPLELTTSRVMSSTSTLTTASVSDLINANGHRISIPPMGTPSQSIIEAAQSASGH
ncbi:unnamed protein product [Hymenolepis diminuta]|uniref:SKI/SNO/DAC domain-containing protein n=1 Tax=Hymenolepis diminuta TaxID=6216 RepID=A0A564YRP7_HYMDI|nr:unnamed protein product [Hymenolepis diminuta]